jgi:hypothetical protein
MHAIRSCQDLLYWSFVVLLDIFVLVVLRIASNKSALGNEARNSKSANKFDSPSKQFLKVCHFCADQFLSSHEHIFILVTAAIAPTRNPTTTSFACLFSVNSSEDATIPKARRGSPTKNVHMSHIFYKLWGAAAASWSSAG